MKKRTTANFIFIAIILTVFLAAMYGFLELADEMQEGALINFDQKIAQAIYQYRNETLTVWVILITETGSAYAYLVLIPIIAFIIFKLGHNRFLTLRAAVILLTSFLINIYIKSALGRPRPELSERLIEVSEHSLSFPSGHIMSAVAFYGFLIYLVIRLGDLFWRKLFVSVFLALLIIAIGVSRIYLGVHYPSDVAAGFLGGLVWLLFCISALELYDRYMNYRKRRAFHK